jgi:hypothetical protein
MQARLSVGGPPSASLALWDWLRSERELRGRVSLEMAPPSPGAMGVVSELVVTSLSTGTAAVLAASIQVWLTQRQADVMLSVTGPDGRQLTIEAHQVAAAETEQLLRNIFGLSEGLAADSSGAVPTAPLGLIRRR